MRPYILRNFFNIVKASLPDFDLWIHRKLNSSLKICFCSKKTQLSVRVYVRQSRRADRNF